MILLLALQAAGLPRTLGAPAPDEEKAVDPHSEEDESGTNPANLQRVAAVFNRYLAIDTAAGDAYLNTLNFRYIEAFADRDMALGLTAPYVATDLRGDSKSGFGDLGLSYQWVPHDGERSGVVVGIEAFLDTASDDVLGRGKTSLGPSALFEYYVTPEFIVAVGYQHNVSVAGDDDRLDIREGFLGLALIHTSIGKTRWAVLTSTLVLNYETDNEAALIDLEAGLILTPLLGGALGVYVRPVAGVGDTRGFDWGVEAGIQLVGF